MKRKLVLTALIIVMMLCVNVFAADAAAVITAYDNEGNIAENLTSGEMKFEATLSELTTDVSFIVVVYKNDEIIDFSVIEKTLPHSEVQTKLSAEVNIPVELSGCTAVAMIWDGIDTMNALCDALVLN